MYLSPSGSGLGSSWGKEGMPAEKEDLTAAASAGREASRNYDWSATEGAAMVAASAAGERALNDGATAEAALAAAAAAWGAVPFMEGWSTAAGAAIVAAGAIPLATAAMRGYPDDDAVQCNACSMLCAQLHCLSSLPEEISFRPFFPRRRSCNSFVESRLL